MSTPSWIERTRVFLKTCPPRTDETDAIDVSAVSSVVTGAVSEKHDGDSSVSSVATPHVFEKAEPANELLADMSRTCRGCVNRTRMGSCSEPVLAGLAAKFTIAWAQPEHAATCQAFVRTSPPVGDVGVAGPSSHPDHDHIAVQLQQVIEECCALRGDGEANRRQLLSECLNMPEHEQRDLIAHFQQQVLLWKTACGIPLEQDANAASSFKNTR